MKITKYNQSCMLIETNDKRILIDPGNIGYDDELLTKWTNIDYIFVSHRHSDHCNDIAINNIIQRDNSVLYTSNEVVNYKKLINPITVKAGDIINLGDITFEITKAFHGYLPFMKEKGNEILENIGIIIDDGKTRLYYTSDTIGFNNDYKCDVLCMPFNGKGLTLGITDGIFFINAIKPKFVLPIHMEVTMAIFNPDVNKLSKVLDEANIKYKILDKYESIVLEGI